MNKVYSAPENSLRELITDFGSPGATSWRIYLLLGIPFMLSAITLEQIRLGGPLSGWLLFALLFWLFTVAVLEALFRISGRRNWKKSRPLAVLAIVALAGLIRGLMVYLIGSQLGFVPGDELSYRLLSAPIFVVAAFASMQLIVLSFGKEANLNKELESRGQELKFLETTLQSQISQLRNALLDKVQNQLKPQLRRLYKNLSVAKNSADLKSAVANLMELVENTVRPLSRDLALSRTIPRQLSGAQVIRERSATLPKLVDIGSMIPLPLYFLLYILLGYPSLAVLTDPVEGTYLLTLMLLLIFGFLLLAKVVLSRFSASPLVSLIIVMLVAVVSSFAALPLELLGISQLGNSYFFQAIIFNVALSSLLFVYQMVKIQVLISQENLQQVVVKLEALTAALRQEAWVIQRNIATVLHGPVQAAMYAAALKLSSLKRPSEKVNQSVKSEIDSAIARLSKPDFLEGESLRAVLEQIQELWSGICEVQIELPQDLDSDLTKRPIVAQCVLEIAREGVSNAVKHGKAKNISIQIAEAQNDFLRISVINDGSVPEIGSELGVGSTLLDELSHSWEIKSRKGLTELRALVSLAKRD